MYAAHRDFLLIFRFLLLLHAAAVRVCMCMHVYVMVACVFCSSGDELAGRDSHERGEGRAPRGVEGYYRREDFRGGGKGQADAIVGRGMYFFSLGAGRVLRTPEANQMSLYFFEPTAKHYVI